MPHTRITLLSMAIGAHTTVCGQGAWEPPGIPFRISEMLEMYVDPVTDALYFLGFADLNGDNIGGDNGLPVYQNGHWDTLAVFNNIPTSMVRWQDTLVVAGAFSSVDGVAADGLAAFANGTWIPYVDQTNAGPWRLRVIDNELYAIGGFNMIDNASCKGIAKRNGGHWESIGMTTVTSANVTDLVKWNGMLVATGAISFGPGQPYGIIYFDGTEWLPLGPGILGLAAPRSLAVYNGDLYVSGGININAGNAGHGIMRWDGTQFHPVGTGFQGFGNTYLHPVGALSMQVHDGLLWAAGSFSFAGNVPAREIASWDGTRWCGLPDMPINDFQLTANTFAFYHDTLYVSTYDTSPQASCALRYLGNTYADTCSLPLSINGPESGPTPSLHVSVVDEEHIVVHGWPEGAHAYAIHAVNGQLVQQGMAYSAPETSVPLTLHTRLQGLYVLRSDAGTVRFLMP